VNAKTWSNPPVPLSCAPPLPLLLLLLLLLLPLLLLLLLLLLPLPLLLLLLLLLPLLLLLQGMTTTCLTEKLKLATQSLRTPSRAPSPAP
jgi:hypothetical protein